MRFLPKHRITEHVCTQFLIKNAQYTIYRFKKKLWSRLACNLQLNFHEDRLIIQGRCMYLHIFLNFSSLIRMVVALMRCEGHFVGCGAQRREVILLDHDITLQL